METRNNRYFEKDKQTDQNQLKERVHWICKNVQGKKVLDIGSPYGLLPFMLGREGKEVLGINHSEEVVKESLQTLTKSEADLKSLIEFEHANFMVKEFNKTFDTIILNEIIQEFHDLDSLFNKLILNLNPESGKVIVTTSFGNASDNIHNRNHYLSDFLKLQNNSWNVSDIEFFGDWFGVIFEKKEKPYQINGEFLNKLAQFEKIVNELETSNHIKNQQYKESLAEFNDGKIESDYKDKYLKEKAEKVNVQKDLVDEYDRRVAVLDEHRTLIKKYELLERRYNNLKSSKLGKITSLYWDIRNKLRRK